MAQPAPTILALKQDFLTTQIRLLSQPLQPSRAWRRANDAAAKDEAAAAVSETALDHALSRLNYTLQQHSRRVYVPQATRLIAEQIETLYLSAGEPSADHVNDDVDGWRTVGADYADDTVIASLPPAWHDAAHPDDAQRYAELAGRLQRLSVRRREVRARVERLRRMRALLAPFGGASAAADGDGDGDGDQSTLLGRPGGVQENLVTRDGEVERELERMRVLLARVGDKVSKLKGRGAGQNDDDGDLFGDGDAMIVDDVEVESRRKVDALLDGLG